MQIFPEDKSPPPKPTVSQTMNVIYRALFVKYLQYLYNVEGSAFVSDLYRQQGAPDVTFTAMEWKTLEILCAEAQKQL